MSALANALDNMTPQQEGENKHIEYGWGNEIREKIVQLHFQLVRTKSTSEIANKYREAIKSLLTEEHFSSSMQDSRTEHAVVLYKLIAQTRDIVAGKGEYLLAHVLIAEWACLLEEYTDSRKDFIWKLVKNALEALVSLKDHDHPLGSWKDVKYFINYWVERRGWNTKTDFHKINNDCTVQFLVNMSVNQLDREERADTNETLVARWIPSESSKKFGWQTKMFAMAYYPDWMESAAQCCAVRGEDFTLTQDPGKRALNKCLTHFRKMKSALNKRLNTPQINQCANTWAAIDFDADVTSITLSKQKQAFQNKKGKGGAAREKTVADQDRLQCAKNYAAYLERCKTGSSTAKGARVSIFDFVKAAREQHDLADIEMTNMQWNDNAGNTNALGEILAMIDVSASMEDPEMQPIYNAVGLGVRIAEKSGFGKRALTFSGRPEWIMYDDNDTFTDMVNKTFSSNAGTNTNIGAAMRMILKAAVDNNLLPEQMVKVLAILSDMQIDKDTWGGLTDHNFSDVLVNQIEQEFREGRCAAAPDGYDMPKVLFWNLRPTDGFPCGANKKNVYMMSGFSPALLNLFSVGGLEALEGATPYETLLESLNHPRYQVFENVFRAEMPIQWQGATAAPAPEWDTYESSAADGWGTEYPIRFPASKGWS